MTAYLHKNWTGLGDRIVVHPRGAPSALPDRHLAPEVAERALATVKGLYGQPFEPRHIDRIVAGPDARDFRYHSNRVYHLDPETLEPLTSFPLQ